MVFQVDHADSHKLAEQHRRLFLESHDNQWAQPAWFYQGQTSLPTEVQPPPGLAMLPKHVTLGTETELLNQTFGPLYVHVTPRKVTPQCDRDMSGYSPVSTPPGLPDMAPGSPIVNSMFGLTGQHVETKGKQVNEEDPCFVAPMKPIAKGITTLVIQNLPGRYSQDDVLNIWPVDGTYDYMHVPYNLLQKRPLGYVFINFMTSDMAIEFQQNWHGKMLPGTCSNRKPLDVAAAEVQGRQANLELIKSRKIGQLGKAGFLPLVLQNGVRLDSKAILAELTGLRNGKAAPLPAKVPEKRPLPKIVTTEEAAAGSDSDSQTTATGGDCSVSEHWADEASQEDIASTPKAASPSSPDPMYVSTSACLTISRSCSTFEEGAEGLGALHSSAPLLRGRT